MNILSLLCTVFALTTALRCQRFLTGLTAAVAGRLAAAGLLLACLAISLRFLPNGGPGAGPVSAVHYATAVMLLVPGIAILGARRPGHRVWPWFVLLPMVLVLCWPVLSHLMSERPDIPVEVPAPGCLGFLLVLVMGAGNYLGTSLTSAAVATSVGILCFVLPATEWVTWPGDGWVFLGSAGLTIAALLTEDRLALVAQQADDRQLWCDFRDIYGMVWARRVVDRINQFSDREQWPVVMTLDGFRPRDLSHPPDDSSPLSDRPGQVLRWVLRRFADETFFSRYQTDGSAQTDTDAPLPVCSRPDPPHQSS